MDDVAPPTADDGHPVARVDDWPEGPGHTVKIAGELDVSNVESVRPVVDRVATSRPRILTFDLSELRFIDSSGLGLLLSTAKEVGTVQLRNPSPSVRRVIEITGVGEVLPLER
jgi:anti-anti-sigma factor